MANTAQARKRVRQAAANRERNMAHRSKMRTFIKKVRAAIAAGDYKASMEAFKSAVPVIDKMVSKGILHKNTAARYKSRLNAKIKALQS